MAKRLFSLLLILVCLFQSTYLTYATNTDTSGDSDIVVGEQMPPTKPTETVQETEETSAVPEPTETDDPDDIIIENTTPTLYTIHFDLNGGSGSLTDLRIMANNPIGTISANITRDGYDFVNWTDEYGHIITDDTLVTRNMTLTAQWKPNGTTPYTIVQKIEKLDGTYTTYNTIVETGNVREILTITPDPIEGFTAPDEENLTILEDGSGSITFKYTRNTYKLTLETGTGVTSKQKMFTYKYEEPVTLEVYLQEDYSNLTVTGDMTEKTFKMPANDVAVTVSATPTQYHIIYKGHGIDTSNLINTYDLNSVPITLDNPVSTSSLWIFNGWTYDGKPITEITDTSHTDMVIHADMTFQWKYILTPLSMTCSTILLFWILSYYLKHKKKVKELSS